MIYVIARDLPGASKTFYCLILDKIKNGIELNDKEYKYWAKIKRKIDKFELIENGCILYYSWGRKYYKNGQLQAIIYSRGTEVYYKNGKLHRDNGPAFIGSYGTKEYWLNGQKYSEEEYWKHVNNRK